jgi:DtxR family transcriptional regulator, Mn-dependent transcriptional regulator
MPETTLSASLEDYLEAIYHIVEEKQAARAGDIARRMRVSSPSVTGALHALAEHGLINYQPYDIITLTAEGCAEGQEIVRRHEALNGFFVRVLGADKAMAETAACEMEHAMPRDLLERFIRFLEFLDCCPRSGEEWLKRANNACHRETGLRQCLGCVEECLKAVRERSGEEGAGTRSRPLHELAPGARGRVVAVAGNPESARRLEAMGIAPGDFIEIEAQHPPDNTILLKARGYHLSLRPDEAVDIRVETF